jgi:hypothetical protein
LDENSKERFSKERPRPNFSTTQFVYLFWDKRLDDFLHNDFTISTISRFKRLSVFLDDEGTHVVAGLVVVLVVRSVAVRELGALPATAEDALERQKNLH